MDPDTFSVLAQAVAHTTVALATDPDLAQVRDLLPAEPPASGTDGVDADGSGDDVPDGPLDAPAPDAEESDGDD